LIRIHHAGKQHHYLVTLHLQSELAEIKDEIYGCIRVAHPDDMDGDIGDRIVNNFIPTGNEDPAAPPAPPVPHQAAIDTRETLLLNSLYSDRNTSRGKSHCIGECAD